MLICENKIDEVAWCFLPISSAMRTGFMPVTNESEEDVNKPYDDLYPIFWLFSRLLMRYKLLS